MPVSTVRPAGGPALTSPPRGSRIGGQDRCHLQDHPAFERLQVSFYPRPRRLARVQAMRILGGSDLRSRLRSDRRSPESVRW